MDLILPFKIGDFAEARSFDIGFRAAWFRCKINNMHVTESGHLEYYLEYIDYTDEGKEWIEAFQKNPNPAFQKRKSTASSQIMLRPPFPQWYRGDQVPQNFSENDVIAIVCDTWKVGDLIDWLTEDCYWTAEITKLLSEDEVEVTFLMNVEQPEISGVLSDKIASYELPSSGQQLKYEVDQIAKVELLKPPMGEGERYLANCKDLRPALDWSVINGWTVPLSKAKGKCWYAAQLIHPKSDIEESSRDEEVASDVDKEEMSKSLKRALNTSEEVPASSNVRPSSNTNSVSEANSQKATITSMKKLRPRSAYKSDPSYGVQAAVVSNRAGICSSSKPPTELVQVQSARTVKGAMAEQNGLAARRYPLRARKLVQNASYNFSDIEESSTDEEVASDVDKEEMLKSSKGALNTSEEVPGSSNLTPSPNTNNLSEANYQKATISSMKKLRPRSTYKSDPSYGDQAAVVSNRRGICSSSKPPTELVQLQPALRVKGAIAEQNGLSARRYPLRARKLVQNASWVDQEDDV